MTPKLIYFKDDDGNQQIVNLDAVCHVHYLTVKNSLAIFTSSGTEIVLTGKTAEKLLMLFKASATFIE